MFVLDDAASVGSEWHKIPPPPSAVAADEKARAEARRKEHVREALFELRTCRELKDELRELGLPVSGLKADLVARLMRATSGRAQP